MSFVPHIRSTVDVTPPSGYCVTPAALNGVVTVYFIGDFDADCRDKVTAALDRAVNDGRTIELDLSEVTFLGSACLHWLVDATEVGRTAGKTMRVSSASPIAERLLQVVGLANFFDRSPLAHAG